jgi:hypothetical protein
MDNVHRILPAVYISDLCARQSKNVKTCVALQANSCSLIDLTAAKVLGSCELESAVQSADASTRPDIGRPGLHNKLRMSSACVSPKQRYDKGRR